MENIILERPFEIKCYNKKIIVDNENIVEEASYYCLPQGRSFKTVKIPDGGKFSIPFFIVGYSGGEEDFDKEVEKGINYIREVTREIEEKCAREIFFFISSEKL